MSLLAAGAIAPEFSLKDASGRRMGLRENIKTGPVLAVLLKISCPTCQLALPFLERLSTALRTIGISQNDGSATTEFNQHFGITFPSLIDPASDRYAVSNAYRITNVPSMFLIDPDGKIEWSFAGFHKEEFEQLARRFGVTMFRESDKVPAMKPG
jgi:peroxiredoxin